MDSTIEHQEGLQVLLSGVSDGTGVTQQDIDNAVLKVDQDAIAYALIFG
jgi:hypothetical protein